MGCTTSSYDNPDIVQKQTVPQPIIKPANGNLEHAKHTTPKKPSSSRISRSQVAPLANHSSADNHIESSGRLSPARSDRTDRSIKRVAFYDEPHLETVSQATVTKININSGDTTAMSCSPTELMRARRKRERNLRKRLLNKMGEAESISERLLLESERLSLTSSMSRTTSRTGSPFPAMRFEYDADEDSRTEGTEANALEESKQIENSSEA